MYSIGPYLNTRSQIIEKAICTAKIATQTHPVCAKVNVTNLPTIIIKNVFNK